ncbi:MAG: diaminopimelate epimerase [Candidatus Melainabacteria bacterium HGW-Melainabacteria-1]|nr:MAG: diaminopimelate epimerase [Candidatus Melainabacteria bacterium HGW-Melainabacteria-1]
MATLAFIKLQGLGNDFILAEGTALPAGTDLGALARRLCDRHFGIGADGLILNWPALQAQARMQIYNADGSEPEMCGNGLRCFVRYLQLRGEQGPDWSIETGAGILPATSHSPHDSVRVEMGLPELRPARIPARGFDMEQVVEAELDCEGERFAVTLVSMGNPHCVIRVADLDSLDLAHWGPILETHPAFPARINVEFVEVQARDSARVKVWERGAGATLACGTGACAVVVAGVLGDWLAPAAEICLPGGNLQIAWPGPDESVWMEGPAQPVFKGEIDLEALNG